MKFQSTLNFVLRIVSYQTQVVTTLETAQTKLVLLFEELSESPKSDISNRKNHNVPPLHLVAALVVDFHNSHYCLLNEENISELVFKI